MKLAFNRMHELGGGIVFADQGEIIYELPLPLQGVMTDLPLVELFEKEKELKNILIEHTWLSIQ